MSTQTQRDVSLAELDPDDIGPGEELYLLDQATNDDGTIDVKVLDWEKKSKGDGHVAEVEFMTPAGDVESEEMPWPTRASREYKFVRLCSQYGQGVVDPNAIKGKLAPAMEDDGEWELRVEREVSVREFVTPSFGWPFSKAEMFETLDFIHVLAFFASIPVLLINIVAYFLGHWGWSVPLVFGTLCWSLVYLFTFFEPEDRV